jgi:hypothetical protein
MTYRGSRNARVVEQLIVWVAFPLLFWAGVVWLAHSVLR